jgi:uncharacterized protein YciI
MNIEKFLANLPTPSAADVDKHIQGARHYTIVFLRQGPAPRMDETINKRLQFEHLQYLMKLQVSGKLIFNGPITAEHEILGMSIYATDMDEARALAEADPKVKAGYLTVEAIPWMAVSSFP